LLALGVNEWRDAVRTSKRAHDALVSIRAEIVSNRRQLVAAMPHHEAVWKAFDGIKPRRPGQLTFAEFGQLFARANPSGYMPFTGQDTAWRLASSSTALADIEYSTRLTLERAYQEQLLLSAENERVLSNLHFLPSPKDVNIYSPDVSLSLDSADVDFSEQRLLKDYDAALQH